MVDSEVVQSCPTLCDPMDWGLPGSSVNGILQARLLEWVAISFSRDLPDPGIKPRSHALEAEAFNLRATREAGPTKANSAECSGGSVSESRRPLVEV